MTARWTCDEVEPKLTAYRLGESVPDEEAAITRHLESCATCRAASEEILATLSLLDDAFSAEEAPLTVLPQSDGLVPIAASGRLRGVIQWLGLPSDRSEWLGSLARAALVLILPLTLVLGLLLPGLRLRDGRERVVSYMKEIEAFTNTAVTGTGGALRASEAPDLLDGYAVALRDEPVLVEVDSVDSPGLAHAFGEGIDILTGTVEVAAEFWSGENAGFDVPAVAGVGLRDSWITNAAALVRATEVKPVRLPLSVPPVKKALAASAPSRQHKNSDRPRLIESVAAHPGYNLTNTPVRTGSESERSH